MAREQQKRRRKRRVVESAYAGDVKPPGFFRLFASGNVIRGVFVFMALALLGGLIAGAIRAGAFGSTGQKADPTFVVPPDNATSAQATPTPESKHYDEAPPFTIDPSTSYTATVKTEAGEFTIELFAEEVPATVNNFVFLSRDGFYDGLAFFEADPEFSAQAGDPRCTSVEDSPEDCSGGPGYEWVQEAPGSFSRGDVGLVNGSQFVIALPESEQLLGQFEAFTPFGRVISGLDVVEQLQAGTRITGITIEEG